MRTKTIQQLKWEISDLSSRLPLCSNSGEGRKVRKEIEIIIRQKEQELNKLIDSCAGCVNNFCTNCKEI